MRQFARLAALPLSALLASAPASADPDRLTNPAPTTSVVAPPPTYVAPQPYAPPTAYAPPPPVTGYNAQPMRAQPVMMSQPAMVVRPPPPAGRQGFFVGAQGGAAIPVAGDYGDLLGTGYMVLGHLGWATPSGVGVRGELGVRSNAPSDPLFAGSAVTSVFYGAALRYTAPRGAFRPYGEVLVDAFSLLEESGTDDSGVTTSSEADTGVSVGLAVGAEFEVSPSLSLEVTARYDHVVLTGSADGPKGGLVGVLGGATLYF